MPFAPVDKNDAQIKTMKLYSQVDRVFNELEALGYKRDSHVPIEELSKYDMYSYSSKDACVELMKECDLNSKSLVFDLGHGIGGPARWLSHISGCSVVGMELQDDLAAVAKELSKAVKLDEKIEVLNGDFCKFDTSSSEERFDAVLSLLVILHIPKELHPTVFKNCHALLKTGGKVFFDDFYQISPMSSEVTDALRKDVYVPGALPTREEYIANLTGAGFKNVIMEDRTKVWYEFCTSRLAMFEENKEGFVSRHSLATYEMLHFFYTKVVFCFASGQLGGARVIATK